MTFSPIFFSNAAKSWNILAYRKRHYALAANDIFTLRGEFCEPYTAHAKNFHHRMRKMYCVVRAKFPQI